MRTNNQRIIAAIHASRLRTKLGPYEIQQRDKIYDVEMREASAKPQFSDPKELFALPPDAWALSILPDGKRTLVLRPHGENAPVPINLLLNWQQSLPH